MKKYKLHSLLLIFFLLFYGISLHAVHPITTTAGKEFRLAFGSNGALNSGISLQLRVIATKRCRVTLTYNSDNIPTETLDMNTGEVRTIAVNDILYHHSDQPGRSNRTLKITSEENIYVYALNQRKYSTEATCVYPVETYGTEYYHFSYTLYTDDHRDGFIVIAHEDNTELKVNNSNIATLNAGELWYYQGGEFQDLTGAYIQVSKPAAMFSVASGVKVIAGGSDNLFEQMVSTDKWGEEIYVPVTILREERIRVIASEENTKVNLQFQLSNDNVTLSKGEYRDFTITGIINRQNTAGTRGVYITADKPIAVGTYMLGVASGAGDPSLAWVPPIEQMVTDTVAIAPFLPLDNTSEIKEHYSQIVVRTSDKGLTYRYSNISNSWENIALHKDWVDHRSGYSYLNEKLPIDYSASVIYRYTNPGGLLVLGYGRGSNESYHYLTASTFKRLNCQMYINDIFFEELEGETLNTCKGLNLRAEITIPINTNQTYIKWYIDGVQQNLPQNTLNWTTPALSSGFHYIKMVVTNSSGTEIPVECNLIITNEDYIWTGTAGDSNWNNPKNWLLANGNATVQVPESCNKVFIPGGLLTYPCLEVSIYESGDIKSLPVCDEITLHFGGEIAWPQNLTYTKAFAEYNYGYYSNPNAAYGSAPDRNRDKEKYQSIINNYTPPVLKRNKFYYLSTPLKKVATGDFSFAGYPESTIYVMGYLSGFPLSGGLTPFNSTGLLMENIQNAALVNVPLLTNSIGLRDHKYLNGLKGIVQLPYFENKAAAAYYPHHSYSSISKESYLYYHDRQTLQLMYGVKETVKRGEEAYRFLFEDDNGNLREIRMSDGQKVTGYTITTPDTDDHLFLGNPFPASINSLKFREANAEYLDINKGFTLYKDELSSGEESYSYDSSNNIPPLFGFGVYVNSAYRGKTIEWRFPLEGIYALTGTTYKGVMPLSFGDAMKVSISREGESVSDRAVLASAALYEASLKKNQLPAGGEQPEVFFVSPEDGNTNLLQLTDDKVEQITVGVRCAKEGTMLQLSFEGIDNIPELRNKSLILEDRRLGVEQDLRNNPVYSFRHQPLNNTGSASDTERFVLKTSLSTQIESTDEIPSIRIDCHDRYLTVECKSGISHISIYNALGYKFYEKKDFGSLQTSYGTLISLNDGIYLIKVMDCQGKQFTKKVILR